MQKVVGTPFSRVPTTPLALPFLHHKKCPMLRQQSQKMCCVGSNSQVYYDNLQFYTEGYLQISKQGASDQGSIAMAHGFERKKHCHGIQRNRNILFYFT